MMTESRGDPEAERQEHKMPGYICRKPPDACPYNNNGLVGLGFVCGGNAVDEDLRFGKNLAPDQARAWRVHSAGDKKHSARMHARAIQAHADHPRFFYGIDDESRFHDPFIGKRGLFEYLAFVRAFYA